MALAPDPEGRFVTSQRGTVVDITHLGTPGATIHFDGARDDVELRAADMDADHFDHAYATTVHRFQGGTVDRTHLYANGGGRELAYVAASRARTSTTIHCVADDLDQAVEDLARDWSVSRRQRWTLDTDTPAVESQRARPELAPGGSVGLRLGQLRVERDAIRAIMPPDPNRERARLGVQSVHLQGQLRELQSGTGRYRNTEVGRAARTVRSADHDLDVITRQLNHDKLSRRDRRKLEQAANIAREELRAARQTWRSVGAATEAELFTELEQINGRINTLDKARRLPDSGQDTIHRRLAALDDQIAALELQAGLSSEIVTRRREPPDHALGL